MAASSARGLTYLFIFILYVYFTSAQWPMTRWSPSMIKVNPALLTSDQYFDLTSDMGVFTDMMSPFNSYVYVTADQFGELGIPYSRVKADNPHLPATFADTALENPVEQKYPGARRNYNSKSATPNELGNQRIQAQIDYLDQFGTGNGMSGTSSPPTTMKTETMTQRLSIPQQPPVAMYPHLTTAPTVKPFNPIYSLANPVFNKPENNIGNGRPFAMYPYLTTAPTVMPFNPIYSLANPVFNKPENNIGNGIRLNNAQTVLNIHNERNPPTIPIREIRYNNGGSPRHNGGSLRHNNDGSSRHNNGGSPRQNNGGSPRHKNDGSPRHSNDGSPRQNNGGSPRHNNDGSPRRNNGVIIPRSNVGRTRENIPGSQKNNIASSVRVDAGVGQTVKTDAAKPNLGTNKQLLSQVQIISTTTPSVVTPVIRYLSTDVVFNKELPQQNGGPTLGNRAMPPRIRGILTRKGETPLENTEMPQEKRSMPPVNRRVPQGNKRMPPGNAEMPQEKRGMPPINRRMPQGNKRMPPGNTDMPPEWKGMPPRMRGMTPGNRGPPVIRRMPVGSKKTPAPGEKERLSLIRRLSSGRGIPGLSLGRKPSSKMTPRRRLPPSLSRKTNADRLRGAKSNPASLFSFPNLDSLNSFLAQAFTSLLNIYAKAKTKLSQSSTNSSNFSRNNLLKLIARMKRSHLSTSDDRNGTRVPTAGHNELDIHYTGSEMSMVSSKDISDQQRNQTSRSVWFKSSPLSLNASFPAASQISMTSSKDTSDPQRNHTSRSVWFKSSPLSLNASFPAASQISMTSSKDTSDPEHNHTSRSVWFKSSPLSLNASENSFPVASQMLHLNPLPTHVSSEHRNSRRNGYHMNWDNQSIGIGHRKGHGQIRGLRQRKGQGQRQGHSERKGQVQRQGHGQIQYQGQSKRQVQRQGQSQGKGQVQRQGHSQRKGHGQIQGHGLDLVFNKEKKITNINRDQYLGNIKPTRVRHEQSNGKTAMFHPFNQQQRSLGLHNRTPVRIGQFGYQNMRQRMIQEKQSRETLRRTKITSPYKTIIAQLESTLNRKGSTKQTLTSRSPDLNPIEFINMQLESIFDRTRKTKGISTALSHNLYPIKSLMRTIPRGQFKNRTLLKRAASETSLAKRNVMNTFRMLKRLNLI